MERGYIWFNGDEKLSLDSGDLITNVDMREIVDFACGDDCRYSDGSDNIIDMYADEYLVA